MVGTAFSFAVFGINERNPNFSPGSRFTKYRLRPSEWR